MKLIVPFFLFILFLHSGQLSGQCCIAIDNTDLTQSLLNTYYPASGNITINAGATSIPLGAVPPNDPFGNSYGTTPISPGDLLLIIQIQGSDIVSANNANYGSGVSSTGPDGLGGTGYTSLGVAGTYEFAIAANGVPLTGGTLLLEGECANGGLVNGYVNADATASTGQRRFQVVRVPRFNSLQLTSNITATAWNGRAGGVIALYIADTLHFNSFTIDASGTGFRGGYQNVQPSGNNISDYMLQVENLSSGKGEGVAGTPRYMWDGLNQLDQGAGWLGYPGGDYGRGAPANAGGGGNDHNAGGGGGGNGGAGGVGGNAVNSFGSSALPNGGRPGIAMPNGTNRLFIGGGGGGGDANNALTGIKGGVGGGMVIIRAGTLAGQGTIRSNGTAGQAGVFSAAPDGAGGGGAGGTIVIEAQQAETGCSVQLQVRGGNGGNTINDINDPHGPGGGGGGGVIHHQTASALLTIDIAGGQRGQTNSGNGINWGSAHGQTGQAGEHTGSVFPDYASVILYPRPSASFQPVTACVNEEITLIDASSVASILASELVSWDWLIEDGTIASGPVVTHVFTEPGEYEVRLIVKTNHDCADTVFASVTILALPDVVAGEDQLLCSGQTTALSATGALTYQWSNNVTNAVNFIPEEGTYFLSVTGTGPNGCSASDSLLMVVSPLYETDATAGICQGQSYPLGDQLFSVQGIYDVPLWSAQGCDSLVHLTLNVYPNYLVSISPALCEGESIQIGNQTYSLPGNYTIMLTTTQGCDSLVQMSLSYLPEFAVFIEERICPGSSITLESTTYSSPGIYSIPLQTASGCDSLVILDLSFNPVYSTTFNEQICLGETFQFEGNTYFQTGIYPIHYTSQLGCDSLITLNLTVDLPYETELIRSICEGEEFQAGGVVMSESGVYEIPLIAFTGCDSLVTVHLEVLKPLGRGFFFPNVFTPNGDGINDTYKLGGSPSGLSDFSISIYNRWGKLIFDSDDPAFEWNGRVENSDAGAGVYYYVGRYSHVCEGAENSVSGYFSLLRD